MRNYYDVNGDGFLSTIDALIIINFLNARGTPEGEASVGAPRSDQFPNGPELRAASPSTSSATDRILVPSTEDAARRCTHDAALLSLSLGVAAGNGSDEDSSLVIDDILDQLIDEIAADSVIIRHRHFGRN